MRLSFHGAAKIVTGSCYLLEVGKDKVLIDCGMFQGRKEVTRKNYEGFGFDPSRVTALILTHAHIDHSGLIPKLVKDGFKGTIWSTEPTHDLCQIMFADSAHVIARDTEHENRRRQRQKLPPRRPLYSSEDAKAAVKHFKPVEYDEEIRVTRNIRARFRNAGHILGSAIIELWANEGDREVKLVFSGDLGQRNAPLVRDPTIIEDTDYLIVESTYGDRLHEGVEDRRRTMARIFRETYDRGGRVMIPSFAVERTQELLYGMNELLRDGEMPEMLVFLDSPLAIKATKIFSKHTDWFDPKSMDAFETPFRFKGLVFTQATADSVSLNEYDEPCVIIAGSGMCTAGRIRHHIRHGIGNPRNSVIFVGFQAEGTLGHHLLDGAETIRMMGYEFDVNAKIEQIEGFSAHADYKDLEHWVSSFSKPPRKVFIVHGEERSAVAFKERLEERDLTCAIPSMGDKVDL